MRRRRPPRKAACRSVAPLGTTRSTCKCNILTRSGALVAMGMGSRCTFRSRLTRRKGWLRISTRPPGGTHGSSAQTRAAPTGGWRFAAAPSRRHTSRRARRARGRSTTATAGCGRSASAPSRTAAALTTACTSRARTTSSTRTVCTRRPRCSATASRCTCSTTATRRTRTTAATESTAGYTCTPPRAGRAGWWGVTRAGPPAGWRSTRACIWSRGSRGRGGSMCPAARGPPTRASSCSSTRCRTRS
mmetsp:Transcript_37008/g.92084  ORF Transcript_37008/g.92084 Transcript_37008/m.92084 type:complete len:246 (+) Transcript_37008:891-1628(+)